MNPADRIRLATPLKHQVVIDLTAAHIWDASSVAALDAIEDKYAQRGKTVEIIGLNQPSAQIHDKLTGRATAAIDHGRGAATGRR